MVFVPTLFHVQRSVSEVDDRSGDIGEREEKIFEPLLSVAVVTERRSQEEVFVDVVGKPAVEKVDGVDFASLSGQPLPAEAALKGEAVGWLKL